MPKSCNASDYMCASLITFSPDMPVLDAINQLIVHSISGAPVVDDRGNLVGMLSELDCLKVALQSGYYGDAGGRVSEYMSTDVKTIDESTSIVDLAQMFMRSSYRRYPVMANDHMVGQISRHDVLRALEDLAKG
ncbi:MAG: CBS domain-containing protein [Gammaproteobacteria bacterium]|nr:CBS domain-containing protein [Gammaproteobacteria bacterium]